MRDGRHVEHAKKKAPNVDSSSPSGTKKLDQAKGIIELDCSLPVPMWERTERQCCILTNDVVQTYHRRHQAALIGTRERAKRTWPSALMRYHGLSTLAASLAVG